MLAAHDADRPADDLGPDLDGGAPSGGGHTVGLGLRHGSAADGAEADERGACRQLEWGGGHQAQGSGGGRQARANRGQKPG
jgi:hypothetical protein